MPIQDTRFDINDTELDKIKRRLEIRYRLKEEGIRLRYDPFLHLKKVRFSDPAIDRYMDLRKKGRQPGAPLQPKIFYTIAAIVVLPVFLLYKLVSWDTAGKYERLQTGDIPYEDRGKKSVA